MKFCHLMLPRHFSQLQVGIVNAKVKLTNAVTNNMRTVVLIAPL